MSRVTPRAARLTAWIAIPVALVASGVVVSTASYSAFSAETVNPTSNWSAGSVSLSDDDNNTAMFAATNLKPGMSGFSHEELREIQKDMDNDRKLLALPPDPNNPTKYLGHTGICRFFEFSEFGIPRFPKFIGVRAD